MLGVSPNHPLLALSSFSWQSWLKSSQLVPRCNPCSRSTIIKSYLPFRGKAFCISLLQRNWGLLFVLPARSHSWASWKFHVFSSAHGHGLLCLLPESLILCQWSHQASWRWPQPASLCCHHCRRHQTPVAQNKTQQQLELMQFEELSCWEFYLGLNLYLISVTLFKDWGYISS